MKRVRRQQRDSLSTWFEIRGRSWVALAVLAIGLSLVGFLCTWKLQH